MGLYGRFATFIAIAAITLTHAMPASADAARRLVSLVDYIGGDYGEAVGAGKVINTAEYAEMQDFARSSLDEFKKLAPSLPDEPRSEIQTNLTALTGLIDQKADIAAIRALTKAIKNRVIDSLAMVTAPRQTPDKQLAAARYQELCAGCHGNTGAGDGPQSPGMEPPPRNFHDLGVLDASSPFKFFNALVLGIEGTPMVSYASSLTDEERWSLAFYVSSIARDQNATAAAPSQWETLAPSTRQALERGGLSLALLARNSDAELRQWLSSLKDLPPQQTENILALLRTAAPYLATTPKDAQAQASADASAPGPMSEPSPSSDSFSIQIAKVRSYLDQARAAFARQDGVTADAILLDGYLIGFEKLEGPLGLKQPDLVTKVEQAFIAAREAARAGNSAKFEQDLKAIDASLDEAASLLTGSDIAVGSLAADFVASLVIILREGFEAFLVIGALLALLRKSGADRLAFRVLHAGWISALAAGLGSYYLFMSVFALTGATRETIEAVCTGTAALMLFYVSFWLLNQAERGRWDGLVRNFANAATTNSKLGLLFGVAFIAVYREAAETVLFYAALASSATSTMAVGAGFIAGTTLLIGVVWGIVHWGVRIPIKRFFLMTSSAMIILSLVLAGKAMNELVEAGYISPTTISPFPTIDLLGIYPHWESLAVQILAAICAGLLAYRQVSLAKQSQR